MFQKFDIFGMILLVGLILLILIAPASAGNNWSAKEAPQTATITEENKGICYNMP